MVDKMDYILKLYINITHEWNKRYTQEQHIYKKI